MESIIETFRKLPEEKTPLYKEITDPHTYGDRLAEIRAQALAEGAAADTTDGRTDGLVAFPAARIVFVVRIRGVVGVSPGKRTALRLLRLNRLFSGVFVRLNKSALGLLKKVEDYVTWGPVSFAAALRLVKERGSLRHARMVYRIKNEKVVQLLLQRFGVRCEEELALALTKGTRWAGQLASLLAPFRLSAPKGGLGTKKKSFAQGGVFGNREEACTHLALRML